MASGIIREWRLNCKVYVGEIGRRGCSKHDLESMFSEYGRIKQTWIAKNPPGFAFIEFYNPRDAERAVRHLDGRKLHGRCLRVQMSTGRSKRSRLEFQQRDQSLFYLKGPKRFRTPSFSDYEDPEIRNRNKSKKEKGQKSKRQYSGNKVSDHRESSSDYRKSKVVPSTSGKSTNKDRGDSSCSSSVSSARSKVTPSSSRKSTTWDRDDTSSCSSTISYSSRSSVESHTSFAETENRYKYKREKVISKRKWKSLKKTNINIKVEPIEQTNCQQQSSEMEISSTKNIN